MNTTKTYICEYCGDKAPWSHQKTNKYCSLNCAHSGRFENTTVARFNEGVTLRKVLAHLRGYRCEVCGIDKWNGKKLVLQVDHINGLANDNSPENLRLICANCHSQTEHLGGKNKGRGRAALGLKQDKLGV